MAGMHHLENPADKVVTALWGARLRASKLLALEALEALEFVL